MKSPEYLYAYNVIAHESDKDFDGYYTMTKGETYYVMVECCTGEKRESSRNKDLILALMTSKACNIRILKPNEANMADALKYENLVGLKFDDAEDVTATCPAQVNKSDVVSSDALTDISQHAVKPIGKKVSKRRSLVTKAIAIAKLTAGSS